MFDQLVFIDHVRELFLRHKEIIATMHFIFPLGTCGGCDNKMERQTAFLHPLHHRIFSST